MNTDLYDLNKQKTITEADLSYMPRLLRTPYCVKLV